MAEPRSVTRQRLVAITRLEPHVARYRYRQHIAHIGVAGTRKMGMRETQDGRIVILIARSPGIALLEIAGLRVRTQLHHSKRVDRPGKHMPVALCAYEWVHR